MYKYYGGMNGLHQGAIKYLRLPGLHSILQYYDIVARNRCVYMCNMAPLPRTVITAPVSAICGV